MLKQHFTDTMKADLMLFLKGHRRLLYKLFVCQFIPPFTSKESTLETLTRNLLRGRRLKKNYFIFHFVEGIRPEVSTRAL